MNKLTINLADFVNAVNAVAPAASKRETRPILTAVHIIVDNETETVTLEACDSAMALKTEIKSFELSTPEPVKRIELNLNAQELVAKLKQSVKTNRAYGTEDVTIEWEDKGQSATLRLDHFGLASVEMIYGDYPTLKNIYKDKDLKESPSNLIVSIGTQLLEKLLASAKNRKREMVTLSFTAKDGGQFMKPFACGFKDEAGGDVTGLLTPMRTY